MLISEKPTSAELIIGVLLLTWELLWGGHLVRKEKQHREFGGVRIWTQRAWLGSNAACALCGRVNLGRWLRLSVHCFTHKMGMTVVLPMSESLLGIN